MEPGNPATRLEQHHHAAFGWALACCGGDRHAAEDALQASYEKVLDGSAVFGGRSALRTWLFAVIRRTAAEQRRRAALGRWLPLGRRHEQRADERLDSEATLVRAQTTARLVAALARLPRRQREVLHLTFYQEFTIAEAAAVLGIGLGTARTHYERGKRRLRALLQEDDNANAR